MSRAMMPMTTKSSTSVKPATVLRGLVRQTYYLLSSTRRQEENF